MVTMSASDAASRELTKVISESASRHSWVCLSPKRMAESSSLHSFVQKQWPCYAGLSKKN